MKYTKPIYLVEKVETADIMLVSVSNGTSVVRGDGQNHADVFTTMEYILYGLSQPIGNNNNQ